MVPAIEVRDLCVSFGKGASAVQALRGLTLVVPQGSVVGFLGPNGAGKTTTMHVLLGFLKASSGSAHIFGRDVNDYIARERIGYLPEHPQTYGFLTGRELLRMCGRLFLIPGKDLAARIESVLELVQLPDAADRRVATYSRGMMQRIGLAEALINDPDLVILDEPTGGLDPIGRMSIRRIIADLRSAGKTVFFSSHELSEVELVCDRVVLVCSGRLAAEGPVKKLVGPGENLEHYFLRTVGARTGTDAAEGQS